MESKNSNTNYTINRLFFARMNGSNQNVIVICCFFSLGPISGMAKFSPFWAGHGSSGYVFRASFAHLSLEIVKKWYYLLSGLSRIFRKPFANVYISPKVLFAQTFQIYACGPRLYKTFHGFLHNSHMQPSKVVTVVVVVVVIMRAYSVVKWAWKRMSITGITLKKRTGFRSKN